MFIKHYHASLKQLKTNNLLQMLENHLRSRWPRSKFDSINSLHTCWKLYPLTFRRNHSNLLAKIYWSSLRTKLCLLPELSGSRLLRSGTASHPVLDYVTPVLTFRSQLRTHLFDSKFLDGQSLQRCVWLDLTDRAYNRVSDLMSQTELTAERLTWSLRQSLQRCFWLDVTDRAYNRASDLMSETELTTARLTWCVDLKVTAGSMIILKLEWLQSQFHCSSTAGDNTWIRQALTCCEWP